METNGLTEVMESMGELEVKYVFGIDLGTTYSVISYLDENWQVQTCSNKLGDRITPSVVDLSGETPVIGQNAKDNKTFYPHSVLSFFKCEMGQGHAVKYYGENYDKETTAIDLSAEVLKGLAEYASDATGSKVAVVVITVPAYFGTEEKKATKEAAEKAGFDIVHLIEEPTAAAVFYGYKGDKNETVMVYDLGGGTFDVVAVEINGFSYDCFAVDGDQQLGGKNWDASMQDIFKRKLASKGIDESDLTDEDIAEIEIQAEKAKKNLTEFPSADVKLRLDAGKAQFEVTRQEFEDETRSLLDRTIETAKKVKEKAEGLGKTITKILMVGGSSYMPQVQERLIAEFPDVEVPNPMDPNMAVSNGAAYYGKKILNDLIAEYRKKIAKIEENKKSNSDDNTGEDPNLGIELPPAAIQIINNNPGFELGAGDIINITKVSVSSIGLKGLSDGNPIIMTLLKRGNKLPTTADLDIPISKEAIDQGKVELQLFEHRLEDAYVDLDNAEAQLNELTKQSGEISSGLPCGSKMHIHMTIDDEGLLKLVATDPNGKEIALEATAEAKSAD